MKSLKIISLLLAALMCLPLLAACADNGPQVGGTRPVGNGQSDVGNFIDADGNAVLVDYKTDRLQKDELENEEKAKEKLISRHERQLKIYAAVCEQMIGRPFSEVLIYSLPLGKAIEVK